MYKKRPPIFRIGGQNPKNHHRYSKQARIYGNSDTNLIYVYGDDA